MEPSKHVKLHKSKLAIKVTLAAASPHASTMSLELSPMASPAPSSGGEVSSSHPFLPRQAASPGPASSAVRIPLVQDKGGCGMPFIKSNPAVPLPTGQVDSATISPLPTSIWP